MQPFSTVGGRGGLVIFLLVTVAFAVPTTHAGEIACGELPIVGLGLEVQRDPVITAVDVPSFVQTLYAGPVTGLSAQGELTGPGISTPITLAAVPGQKFAIPALHEKGDYALQNIRLVGASGEFLQQAIPSAAVIQVTDVLQTKVKVRQLTAEELRERGIFLDERNYDVFEYTFVFGVDEQKVEIPYPVVIDKRTHEITPLPSARFAMLPFPTRQKPPRFTPPSIETFDLSAGGAKDGDQKDKEPRFESPTLPAALVVPSGFGVLHQFFAVILQVGNSAPDGSNIRLDSITAKLSSPLTMRVAKVMPAVSIGQPVPIVDEHTGAAFLVAGAQGSAEWSLEALKAGTHTIDIDVRATYQKPGQEDFGLAGHVATSLVVSDPRFHVNFSHPDVVRKDNPYTAYAFVTNLSAQRQHVFLDLSDIPPCSSGSSANNVCRTEGNERVELDLGPGEMAPVPHKLMARVTGKVFAAAGAASDEAIGVSIHLTMGVSQSGIPLSPATLVMPYYAQFLPADFVDAQMQLLGLGYSLATAPLTPFTATKPRVITTDVFRRAQQIALAGQRIFIIRENRDAFVHLSLDLLGNVERVDQLEGTPELAEWDELRRTEEAGRIGAAAMARQLESIASTPMQFVDEFAAAASHRSPFFFAYVQGPHALSVHGSSMYMDRSIRGIPYGELTKFDDGELAIVGRWSENLRVSILPQSSSFTLHLLYPDTANGTTLRSDIDITNAQIGMLVTIDVARGSHTLVVKNASANPVVNTVPQTPLRILGAAQDLNLDGGGHIVSLLFNRPFDTTNLRDLLSLTINVPKASYTATRNVAAAVLQEDGRIAILTCDKTLSKNAEYSLSVQNLGTVVPRIDNDRPAAILTGKVLQGDNTPIPHALVRLLVRNARTQSFEGGFPELIQYDVAGSDGRYLFEYVPRDVDQNLFGVYDLLTEVDGKQASLTGSVRLPGEVHLANLVFLGSGTARGQVRWDDGTPIPNANVTAGSSLFGGMFGTTADANGRYELSGLPVGPLVFSTVDPDGRIVYATNSIRTAGEVITQDLVAIRKDGPAPGFATVRVQVLRSDTMQPVSAALVGAGSEFVQLSSTLTDTQGRAEFRNMPAGLISIIASDTSISRHGAAVEVELHRDQVLDQTLVLQVADPTVKYGFLEGVVTRDDPAAPGDGTKDQPVANAVISIFNLPNITANVDGTYVYPDIPLSFAGRWIQVFDPLTSRHGWFHVPTLVEGANRFPIRLSTTNLNGKATMRVHLTGGRGEPVAGARVFAPGFPPTHYAEQGGGVYDLADVPVPQSDEAIAVMDDPNGPYGEQFVRGATRVDFDGQIGITDLHLPGIGTVVVRLESGGAQAIGPVAMTYAVWDDYQQKISPKTIIADPDPATNLVTFHKVPARQDVIFSTVRHPAGFASDKVMLAYDGDARELMLHLQTIGDVSGRVFAHDGITPLAGATVRIETGTAVYAPAQTKQDGSFVFAAIPGSTQFNVIAELNQDGVFRTGIVSSKTPDGGGPVNNLIIVMREQATVEGRVVSNSDNTPVPLAHYWLRELAWPYRSIGTAIDPLTADIHGRFLVSNVFTGAFRVTAVASDNQEIRGDYQGALTEEGDVSQRDIQVRIGGAGVGSVSITVTDSLLGFEPVPNAEVTLTRNGANFDFTTTNDAGVAFFDQVPAGGDYKVFVFSKQRGRSGQSDTFSVSTAHTTSISVHLDFLGVVSGSLTDPDASNAPVPAQPVTYDGPISLRATTGADGSFAFHGVPEGAFGLQAWELTTQRIAEGPQGLFISKLVPEQRNIHLELERMGTLTVKVYLPNDAGGPGELAPLVEATATQCTICNVLTPDYPYFRSAQGNPVVFPRMFRRVGYGLEIRELGGEARTVHTGGMFAAGELAHEQIVVLPQSGTVEIVVRDGSGNPVGDAEVNVSGAGSARVFTPANGTVSLNHLPFGFYSVQAKKGNVTAAAAGELKSRSQPLQLTLNLGTNITVTGHVDAEEGIAQPSPRTRVVITVTTRLLDHSLRLETLTDANGDYTFTGIPVGGTSVSAIFFGPDDSTVGASLSQNIPDGAIGTITLPRVKLDATPPRVLNLDPPANATNVSPSSPITVTFSEQIRAADLNSGNFELIATDDGSRVQSSVTGSVRPDGTYVVKVIPPPGTPFPLKSNVLYRFAVSDNIQDTTGNRLRTTIGSSFTTVNYTEPAIVRIDPNETTPLPEQLTLRIKFNKAVDAGTGTIAFERLDAYKGSPIATIPVSRTPDVTDPTTIVVAPVGVAIAESSFYRLTVSGVADTQSPPNVQRDARVFDFFSFDHDQPVITITSPTGKLTTGVLYTAGVSIDDSDIAYVDWLDAAGVSIARVKTKPFGYDFVAPNAPSFTLKATATDLSGNTSDAPASFTWEVAPNAAPTDITVTNDVASVYPGKPVQTRVHFKDEGVAVTVALELRGTALDGSELRQVLGSRNVTRVSGDFPEAIFQWTAPLALKDGTARVIATATDSVNNAGTGESAITILLDQTKPQLVSFTPAAETRYAFNDTYTIEAQVNDAETGIARVVFTVGGVTVLDTSGPTFRKTITVPPKNADTRVPVVVTAYDQRGNFVTDTHEVIYERVDDATLPRAAWITPLDGAALPSNQNGWQTTLRIQATDDVKVTSVRFESTALAAPIELTAPKSGDLWETKAALTFGSNPFVITAIVNDGDPAHAVELPITIDPVAVSPTITGDINITNLIADQYANKSVLIRGNVLVYITVPLTLRDLILVDGATLSVSEETKLDLTITDHLFVDADSRIDVTGKGYRSGRTLNGEGAINADASHAGIGGSHLGTTNATYGSITAPSDFGSGGGAGGNGGGAMALRGQRFVIAGLVRADGETNYTAGSGGSVLLDTHALITGPLTRITANGGDAAEAADQDRGGGGGRIAVRASDRLDLDASVLQARGGRNGSSEGAQFIDGGAGTVVLNDQLTVSAFDERHPNTTHRTAGTPIGSVNAITIGPRVLARFDAAVPANLTVDPTAMVLAPTDIPSVSIVSTSTTTTPQYTPITATYHAASTAGIREVRTILSAQPNDVVAYAKWATSVPDTASSILVPDTTTPGPATLKIRVTDRAGRIAESAPFAFNVIANTAPVIDTFDVTTETYAGHDLAVTASASDDVAVTSLTLTSTVGTVSGHFTVTIPPSAPTNTNVTLTLAASDGFPSRAATTQTRTVLIKRDTIAPTATIVAPTPNQQFDEASGATFTADVTAFDAEVAVQRVTATLESIEYDLAFANGHWTKALPVPSVDGVDPVAKTLTIRAYDYEGNATAQSVTFLVKPLIDPNAPTLKWSCASPGAMFPPGYEIALRIMATPASQANGVSSITMSFNNGAPVAATLVATNTYEAKYTIPSGTTDGTSIDVKVTARSTAGNESTLLGTLTAVAGVTINTTSTIAANDTAFENQSVIVANGGVLTIIGPHRLRNLVVLNGGRLIQQHVDPLVADALRADRFFMACGATIDLSGVGLGVNTSYPGAGTPDSSSGGSHIGRGTTWWRAAGGVYGSLFEPKEPGGGGNSGGAGGGAFRMHATGPVAIDGSIRTNGASSGNGAGAGGSVWITTSGALSGSGSIEAYGGNGGFGGGGGGAIALEYASTADALTLDAHGGTSSVDASRHAAAGTVFRRVANSSGDLVIDNKGVAISATSATELPAFGRASIASINGSSITLNERRWISAALVGHRLRAYAPDGSIRGTYRIAAITNNGATLNAWADVPTNDSVDYDGYLLYSPTPLGGRKLVAVRLSGAQWQYDNDSAFVSFTPTAGQLLFATFSKSGNRFRALDLVRCDAACGTVSGIQLAEVAAGSVIPEMFTPNANEGLTNFNAGEIFVRGDAALRAFTLVTAPPSITLEKLTGADVQSGASLRGLYLFDTIKLSSARVISEDLVESVLVKDAASSLTSGNPSAPVIDTAKITIGRGLNGPVIIGAAGAISDANGPLEVAARNGNLTAPTPQVMLGEDFMGYGTVGGFSVKHVDNNRTNGGSAGTLRRITGDGSLAFSPSQTNANIQLGLSPNDAAGDFNEPGHNTFRLNSNGTYEVWANAINANKNGTYTTNTAFRIEKSGTALRWYVDNTLVHEVTSGVPASLVFEVSFYPSAFGEIGSIEYGMSLPSASIHAKVASDGSFRIPISGTPGDPIRVRARDRHAYSLESDEVSIGNIPSDIGVQSIEFHGNESGTVTLRAPAGSEGALVLLKSDNSAAVVPSSITVLPNADSATFPITTSFVLSPVNATITATYGGSGTSAVLTVNPPSNAVSSLTLDPSTVEGGASLNATVTLGIPAPAGGATVVLSSSDSARASIPASIVIPAGATTASFTVTTARVATPSNVTLGATWGSTKSATLNLSSCTPLGIAPLATTAPTTIWFDDAPPAGASGSAAFDTTQSASGAQSLHFTPATNARTWSFTNATPFVVNANDQLEIYALADPCNPPRQIAVSWNNVSASWGEALINPGTQSQTAAMIAGGVWTRLSIPASGLTNVNTLTISVYGGEAWFDLAGTSACTIPNVPSPAPQGTVWFNDTLPAGATASGDATFDGAVKFANATGTRNWTVTGATSRMNVAMGDVIYTYVFVDPCNPPREISLELNGRAAYWGDDLIGGTSQSELSSRTSMGPVPQSGAWARLEIPASTLKADATSLSGIKFSIVDGAAWFDVVGTIPRTNLALNKTATQSSDLNATWLAPLVVDGNINNFDHTNSDNQAWWQVDLGSVQSIDTISIWNRTDCCAERVQNFWIFVSDVPFTSNTVGGVRAFHHVAQAGRPSEIRINRSGRYVRVQLESASQYLNLAEVQVWATIASGRENFAGGSTNTSHASFYEGLDSERAVDGRVDGQFADYSLTHTQSQANAWWEIDLGRLQSIDRIDLWNRSDCCRDRLTNFYVFVSDVPFTSKLLADTLAQSGVGMQYFATPPRAQYSFDMRRTGRYVRVQLNGTNVMSLSEVRIWSKGVTP